jgi:hypothetical protein
VAPDGELLGDGVRPRAPRDRAPENNGEGLLLYAKVKPYVERYRQDFSPFAFQNAQWAAERTERGRALVAIFEKRIAGQMAAAKA